MKLLYAFPEPLPIPRARGLQVAHAMACLAEAGVGVALAHVPVAGQNPFDPLGYDKLPEIETVPLSRAWPGPLGHIPPFRTLHSTRFFASRLWREVNRRHPDFLYVRHLKLAALATERRDLPPLIYEAHEIFSDTAPAGKRKTMAALEQRTVACSAGIVCNSRATAERLVQRYGQPRRLLILPNGVMPQPEPPDKPWVEARRHIVYAGSFFGWKGVDDIILAARALPGFKITLMGGEAEQIERLRGMLGPQGAEIEFLPRLPQKEVARHLAHACIAILPNRPEPDSAFTSPIKLFEYMAAGCALVASDLPSLREILDEEDAAWFPAGSPEALATAMRALADAPNRASAMGRRLRAKSASYTWAARAERLKAFLSELLDSTKQ